MPCAAPGSVGRLTASHRDDLAGHFGTRTADPMVSGEQRGVLPFGGSHVDRVGVAQRLLRQLPGSTHVAPRRRLDGDLEGLRILQGLWDVRGREGVPGSIRGRCQTRHDLEREVARSDQWFGGSQASQGLAGCDPRRPESATASMTTEASMITG